MSNGSGSIDPAHRWTWERALRERSAIEGMRPVDQHIALMLATHADPAGDGIRPSVATLAKAVGKGRSSVSESLKHLRESGWIVQIKQGNGFQELASTYVLAIPAKSGQPDSNKPS